MNEYDMLLALVDEFNDGAKNLNACAYDGEFFVGARTVTVRFFRNRRVLYSKLLRFCADHALAVISTHPATYETVVRVSVDESNVEN